jgi:tocopherol cyclase
MKMTKGYQGHKRDKYFEGWYFKLVSSTYDESLVLIPGVSQVSTDPHAFIQIFYRKESTLKRFYVKYELSDFLADQNQLSVKISNNYFSEEKIILDINNNDLQLNGNIKLKAETEIKRHHFSPTIMGPFAYLPFMECNHEVIHMKNIINGEVTLNKHRILFIEEIGYIEKDYGVSFPSEYIWLQGNHFNSSNTSFFFSYATIPYLKLSFKGLISVLYIDETEYRFATYNQSKVLSYHVDDDSKSVEIVIKRFKLTLVVKASIDNVIDLPSPIKGHMTEQIKEGITGLIELKLYEKDKLIYTDQSTHCGVEIMMKNKKG